MACSMLRRVSAVCCLLTSEGCPHFVRRLLHVMGSICLQEVHVCLPEVFTYQSCPFIGVCLQQVSMYGRCWVTGGRAYGWCLSAIWERLLWELSAFFSELSAYRRCMSAYQRCPHTRCVHLQETLVCLLQVTTYAGCRLIQCRRQSQFSPLMRVVPQHLWEPVLTVGGVCVLAVLQCLWDRRYPLRGGVCLCGVSADGKIMNVLPHSQAQLDLQEEDDLQNLWPETNPVERASNSSQILRMQGLFLTEILYI